MTRVGKQVRAHWYGALVACLCCLLVGTGLSLIIGRSQTEYWIVFGGNTDPGDGQGGGLARGQFVGGGWTDNEHIYQVPWGADIAKDTTAEANAAMAAGHAAYDKNCRIYHCIVAGFSLGNAPAIQLATELGLSTDLYMFGAPQPSSGIYHNPFVTSPFIQFWTDDVGGLNQDRPVPAGAQAFYDTRDPYANGGPQCGGPGWFAITLDGHYIVSRAQADGSHIWTGPDGVLMHEVNYVAQPGIPLSGSDPPPFWSLCPPSLQPPKIPTVPPGTPQLPGIPTGG